MIFVLYVLLALLFITLSLHFLSPKEFFVKSKVIVKREPAEIFEYLRLLKNQSNWSFWEKDNRFFESGIIGEDGELGAVRFWESATSVGQGEQKIIHINAPHRIDTELSFMNFSLFKCFLYYKVGRNSMHKTFVEVGFSAKMGFPVNIMVMLRGSRKRAQLGFDESMQNLKAILEVDSGQSSSSNNAVS
ncbi:SRPBCC family protein [Sediminicola luteus]|uniref:Polyketide cyclase n=1 Tax=Sediminicola luteus TaxID=319238 RepID=A0A2A4G3X2_9FLAO|nr:hypothetical protein [Sediminicola luteus]PCE62425.1 hypothetical protein B7P33_18910 [Sediminicola luteus]